MQNFQNIRLHIIFKIQYLLQHYKFSVSRMSTKVILDTQIFNNQVQGWESGEVRVTLILIKEKTDTFLLGSFKR